MISGIPDSVQDSELESTVTSVLSDIDVNVKSELVNLIMAHQWKMSFNPDLNKQAQEVIFQGK